MLHFKQMKSCMNNIIHSILDDNYSESTDFDIVTKSFYKEFIGFLLKMRRAIDFWVKAYDFAKMS